MENNIRFDKKFTPPTGVNTHVVLSLLHRDFELVRAPSEQNLKGEFRRCVGGEEFCQVFVSYAKGFTGGFVLTCVEAEIGGRTPACRVMHERLPNRIIFNVRGFATLGEDLSGIGIETFSSGDLQRAIQVIATELAL